jgi:DNA-binding NarL/FixJ family response regulator
VSQVRQAGARGYVLTNSAESELLNAVAALSHGRPFFASSAIDS